MCIQTWFISCGHRGNTAPMPRPKTYITHTKGGDQRPEIGYIWLPRPRVREERGKKEICRKKLPEGMEGKK